MITQAKRQAKSYRYAAKGVKYTLSTQVNIWLHLIIAIVVSLLAYLLHFSLEQFLIVILAAGAPAYLAVLSLAYFSNLGASLTHYGTTPAPIYFGAGYTSQRSWWTLGLITSLVTILIWSVIGFTWWKILGLW